jgi:predicted O-methyltransferase YrrM
MDSNYRSRRFSKSSHLRHWWHRRPHADYVPPIFSILDDEEWDIMASWFADTEKLKLVGEASEPLMNVFLGFIMGSGLSNIVQCGHYSGYSTLIFGFMLRKMGRKNSLFTVDIDKRVSDYTEHWVGKAGLSEYVHVEVGDSADTSMPEKASSYFDGPIRSVFIDSSHQYAHTLRELDLWYEVLTTGGLMFLHDISDFAKQYDSTKEGGVERGLQEWLDRNSIECVRINKAASPHPDSPYADPCGLGIIHKPHVPHDWSAP